MSVIKVLVVDCANPAAPARVTAKPRKTGLTPTRLGGLPPLSNPVNPLVPDTWTPLSQITERTQASFPPASLIRWEHVRAHAPGPTRSPRIRPACGAGR